MPHLNLEQSEICMETELDAFQIRRLINEIKNELGIVYFKDYRTPLSYGMVIDGINDSDEQYRVCISIRDDSLFKIVTLSACGSSAIDRFKAKLFFNPDMLYSMDLSVRVRDALAYEIVAYEKEQFPNGRYY